MGRFIINKKMKNEKKYPIDKREKSN